MRAVGAKAQVLAPSWAAAGSGVAALEMTSQWSGAVTVKAKVAFRSGCSKTANTRRESGTSNCE